MKLGSYVFLFFGSYSSTLFCYISEMLSGNCSASGKVSASYGLEVMSFLVALEERRICLDLDFMSRV